MSTMSGFEGGWTAFEAPLDARMTFIRKTYLHVAGAMVAFVILSTLFYQMGLSAAIARVVFGGGQLGWLAFLGAFMIASWLATSMAQSDRPLSAQYTGLAVYTVAEALIFAPLLYIAARFAPAVLPSAAGVTLLVFGGLSAFVMFTKQDFSFMRTGLCIAGLVAMGVIVLGAIFGWSLGVWFSGAMILFASGAILYTTSNVLHHYRTDQYVAAALELFSSVALLFWYVLRLFLSLGRRD
jgi:FtsH-binding integral membrane protein